MVNTLDLLDDCIADLESKLGLQPGQSLDSGDKKQQAKKDQKQQKAPKKQNQLPSSAIKGAATKNETQPDICKLEFKVGVITKVWVHPNADKLYCEEIDVGEETGPRQIASGLRPHFTEEQMLGQRLLVVSNLKAKNLVGFKSHGMVLCAAKTKEGTEEEEVQFVEPPVDAPLGEVVSFEGLPVPEPWSAAQVEKKKVFIACMGGMASTEDCKAAWNGHIFTTSTGPCTTKSIGAGGVLR
jgi:aminoacyl tRNA synthase complex-interacting multifunctional protein 1